MKRILIHMPSRMEQHILSGSIFPIDRRLERLHGNIYLERNFIRHPSIAGARSVILPRHHLWVLFFEGQGAPHPWLCYMHMAQIRDEGDTVVIEDLYLDVIVERDGRWHLVDVDEFRAAIASGELTAEQVQVALKGLENACRVVEGAGGDLEAYLYETVALEGVGCKTS